MGVLNIFLISFWTIIILLILYIVIFRPYILALKKFTCLNCGNCCKLRVYLSKEDIKRIEKKGYKNFFKRTFFLKRAELKKINGNCIFIGFKRNNKNKIISFCKINKIKPGICAKYPLCNDIFGKSFDYRCNSFKKRWW